MKKVRNYLILQTDSTCQHCDTKTKDLELHHIVPQQVELDNSLSNVILVCKKCHQFIEKVASESKSSLKTISIDQPIHRLIMLISFKEDISFSQVIAKITESYYNKNYSDIK